jgi:hypothetical protein
MQEFVPQEGVAATQLVPLRRVYVGQRGYDLNGQWRFPSKGGRALMRAGPLQTRNMRFGDDILAA